MFSLIKYSIRISIVYVPISLYFGLELKYLFFAYLSLFLIVPFAVSLGLLISTIILRFKRDAEPLTWMLESVVYTVFPASFSLMIFSEPLRTYLEIFIPSFAVIEEIRKFAILGNFNHFVLASSIVVSFIYLLLSILLFKFVYDKGRKEGWIYLK